MKRNGRAKGRRSLFAIKRNMDLGKLRTIYNCILIISDIGNDTIFANKMKNGGDAIVQ